MDATTKLIILFLVIGVQFALAVFCLTRLAYCNISIKKYVIWNICIMLIIFIGGIVFLCYYFTHKKELLKGSVKDEQSAVPISPSEIPQNISEDEKTLDGAGEEKSNSSQNNISEADKIILDEKIDD